ncbi:MAG TPA: lipopolysaccharide heptosyltransferase II [Gammaproteobacteria bacterium]|nr:lipopolysaccharide heptosyltransferase II [Gammaproteobacteria bacterium]
MNRAETHRILVVGPAWVGDMVMAQSLFITLKQRFPNSEIDVLAPSWSRPLLARMPEVHAAVMLPVEHGQFGFGVRQRLGRALNRRYHRAVVLPRSWKSALVPAFAHIPVRTGYRGEWRYGLINDMRKLDKQRLTQTVQRYVALGLPKEASLPPAVPPPRLRVDKGNQAMLLDINRLHLRKPVVAFLPGAEYGPAKRWPIERYAELAEKLVAAGKQVWVFGSAKEHELGDAIVKHAVEGVTNLCGSTKLADAVDLLALAETAVSNDSGLMHMAAAVGVKLVALYGSSSPDYTPPLTDRAEVVYLRLECSPCFKRECPLGHLNCLRQIGVDDVYQRVSAR